MLIVVPLMALASGSLTLLGRTLSMGLNTLVLGVSLASRAGLYLRARIHAVIAPIFTFEPPSLMRERPSDGRFHAENAKEAAKAVEAISTESMALVHRTLVEAVEKGDETLPENVGLLARLLSDQPPTNDFQAADMIRDCFADFGTSGIRSRALLCVALNLSRHFARPTRLPLATTRAWRMLDPVTFEDEIATQLSMFGRYIMDWQKSQNTFLCLDNAEIEMIEVLFEGLHPGHHAKEMTDVLNFKVLSNRRQGLLRRIPHRLRKAVQGAVNSPESVEYIKATQTFLSDIASARNYQPIIDAAAAALDEINKFAEKALPPPAQTSLPAMPAAAISEAQALARITPVKMPASELPASELAVQAMREATAPQPRPSPPPVQPPAQPPVQQQPRPTPSPPQQQPQQRMAPAVLPRLGGSRADAAGPLLSAERKPLPPRDAISVSALRETLPSVSTRSLPLPPGKRPELPAIAMGKLPVLAGTGTLPPAAIAAPAQRTPSPVTGRISIPAPGARPVVTTTSPAPQSSPTPVIQSSAPTIGSATGRILPPGTITDLTVVPQKKRPPITSAVKRQSVLKILRGESASTIAAALGIRASKLDEWVDAFITAGAGALTPSKPKRVKKVIEASEPLSAELLRAKLAEVLATAQMIERAMDTQISTRRPILLPPPDQGKGHGATKHPRKKG